MELTVKIKSSFLLVILIMAVGTGIILWNQNTLQDAFSALKTSFELEEYLLECRRQEKNFFLRRTEEALHLHQTNYDSLAHLTVHLLESTINPAFHQNFTSLELALRNYKAKFDEIVQSAESLTGTQTTFQDPSDELVRDARVIHSLIYDIRAQATQQFNTTRSTTHIVNLSALLISVFLSVIITGYLSDKITDYIHHPS